MFAGRGRGENNRSCTEEGRGENQEGAKGGLGQSPYEYPEAAQQEGEHEVTAVRGPCTSSSWILVQPGS